MPEYRDTEENFHSGAVSAKASVFSYRGEKQDTALVVTVEPFVVSYPDFHKLIEKIAVLIDEHRI